MKKKKWLRVGKRGGGATEKSGERVEEELEGRERKREVEVEVERRWGKEVEKKMFNLPGGSLDVVEEEMVVVRERKKERERAERHGFRGAWPDASIGMSLASHLL